MPTGSGWGYGKWWDTLIWGYQMAGVLAKGAVISDSIVSLLAQTTPAVLAYSATIEIDGVDITSHCGPFTITHRGRGGVSSCEFSLLDGTVTPTLYQNVVSVTVGLTDSAGITYTQERFRGKLQVIETEKTASVTTRRLVSFDLGYGLTQTVSQQTTTTLAAAGMSALDLIAADLAQNGFGPASGSFVDYIPGVWNGSAWGNTRNAIHALAVGNRDSVLYVDPEGNLILTDYADTAVSPFLFPLAAQTDQQPAELVQGYANQCLVYWWAFDFANGPYRTGGEVVNDLADQALKGVIKFEMTVQSIHYLDSAAVKSAAAQAAGLAYVAANQKTHYSWGSPLNPFLFPGHVCTLTLAAGGTAAVRIDGITETGGPDGYWASWEGRATA